MTIAERLSAGRSRSRRWKVPTGLGVARLAGLACLSAALACAGSGAWRVHVVPSTSPLTFHVQLPPQWTATQEGDVTTVSSPDKLTMTLTTTPLPLSPGIFDLDVCAAALLQPFSPVGGNPLRDSLWSTNLRHVTLEAHAARAPAGPDRIARVACYETATELPYPLISVRVIAETATFEAHRSEIVGILDSLRFRPAA